MYDSVETQVLTNTEIICKRIFTHINSKLEINITNFCFLKPVGWKSGYLKNKILEKYGTTGAADAKNSSENCSNSRIRKLRLRVVKHGGIKNANIKRCPAQTVKVIHKRQISQLIMDGQSKIKLAVKSLQQLSEYRFLARIYPHPMIDLNPR